MQSKLGWKRSATEIPSDMSVHGQTPPVCVQHKFACWILLDLSQKIVQLIENEGIISIKIHVCLRYLGNLVVDYSSDLK